MAFLTRKTISGLGAEVLANKGRKFLQYVEGLPDFFNGNEMMNQAFKNAMANRTTVLADGSVLQTQRGPIGRVTAAVPSVAAAPAVVRVKSECWLAVKAYDAAHSFIGHLLSKVFFEDGNITNKSLQVWEFVPGAVSISATGYQPGADLFRPAKFASNATADWWEIYPNASSATKITVAITETPDLSDDTRVYETDAPPPTLLLSAHGTVTDRTIDEPALVNAALGLSYSLGRQSFVNTVNDEYSGSGYRVLTATSSFSGPFFWYPLWGRTFTGQRKFDATGLGSVINVYAKSASAFFGGFTSPTPDIAFSSLARSSANYAEDTINPYLRHSNLVHYGVPYNDITFGAWFYANTDAALNYTSAVPAVSGAIVKAVYCGQENSVYTITGSHIPLFRQAHFYDTVAKVGLLSLEVKDSTSPTWQKFIAAVSNGKSSAAKEWDVDPATGFAFALTDPVAGNVYVRDQTGQMALAKSVGLGASP